MYILYPLRGTAVASYARLIALKCTEMRSLIIWCKIEAYQIRQFARAGRYIYLSI